MKIIIGISILIFMMACTNKESSVKSKFVTIKPHHTHKNISKTRGFLNVSITQLKSDEDSVHLEATVFPNKDMDGSQIEWKIPEEAKVIDGALDENVNFLSGQSVKYSLILSKESLKNGNKIFFFAYQMNDGERFGSSTNHVYVDQEHTIEAEAQSLEKVQIQKKKMIQ